MSIIILSSKSKAHAVVGINTKIRPGIIPPGILKKGKSVLKKVMKEINLNYEMLIQNKNYI
jgi:hypothetical protein